MSCSVLDLFVLGRVHNLLSAVSTCVGLFMGWVRFAESSQSRKTATHDFEVLGSEKRESHWSSEVIMGCLSHVSYISNKHMCHGCMHCRLYGKESALQPCPQDLQ